MKYLYYITFVILLVCCAIEKNNQELVIRLDYCKYDNEHTHLKEFTLLKDGIEIKNIQVEHKRKITIPDLSSGNYTIQYKSIYNQLETLPFKLNTTQTDTVTICVDKLDYSANRNLLLIDQMETDEILTIAFDSEGCFSFDKDELRIKKTKNGFLILTEDNPITVNESQLRLLREFEIELRSNHSSGCSTRDSYTLYYEKGFEMYSIVDSSCEWRGFTNLLKKLNIKK